jgi:hypothetical protein
MNERLRGVVKPTTFSSVWYPFPTTLRFFVSKPDAISFFTAASAESPNCAKASEQGA